MGSYNQHGYVADFGMMVIVGGQKVAYCPPQAVSLRINRCS